MDTNIKQMTPDDISQWLLLSNEYDKYVKELQPDLKEWYIAITFSVLVVLGVSQVLVRRILELVSGDITVHSKLDEGTTFTVRLEVE